MTKLGAAIRGTQRPTGEFDHLDLAARWHAGIPAAVAAAEPGPVGLQPLSGEVRVNTATANDQYAGGIAALANGGHVVVLTSFDSNFNSEVFAQLYDASGAPQGGEFRVNETTNGRQGAPKVTALANGGFVVLWHGPSNDGGISPLYFRLYSDNGAPITTERTAGSTAFGSSITALQDGAFLIFREDPQDVLGQRFNSVGTAVGGSFRVNASTDELHGNPVSATLADGSYVVGWSLFQDIDGPAPITINFRIFAASGTPLSGDVVASAPSTNTNWIEAIVALDNGNFVVIWSTRINSPDVNSDVMARIYSSAGQPVTDEFRVNLEAGALDWGASAVALDDGGFLIAWTKGDAANTNFDVVAQRFDPGGARVDAEFAVNQTMPSEQSVTSERLITQLPDGTVVIVWYGNGPGDDSGVFMRRFEGPAAATPPIVGTPGPDVLVGTSGDDVIQGLAGDDVISGEEGADDIEGGEGNDRLYGGSGADTLTGGTGDDWHFVDGGDTVIEGAGEGSGDRVFASTSYTLSAGAHIEIMSTDDHAGTSAIDLGGNELDNLIYGNAGNNRIDGHEGADAMIGFGGDDWYYVDDSRDLVREFANGGTDRVYASVSYVLAAGSEVEVLLTDSQAGTAAINLSGNGLNNIIYGNAGDNVLNGRGGADTMVGFGGNDWFYVDNAGDRVVEGASEGAGDRVFASTSWTLSAGAHIEILSTTSHAGTAAINLFGNELGNSIYGNAGSNVLDGKGGNDTLVGFAGTDTFAFTTALGAGNVDRIADFDADDTIALDNAVFTGLSLGALSANAFVTGTGAQDADDRIVYSQATGQLFYDADGNGAGAQMLFATLQGAPVLTAGDFTVI